MSEFRVPIMNTVITNDNVDDERMGVMTIIMMTTMMINDVQRPALQHPPSAPIESVRVEQCEGDHRLPPHPVRRQGLRRLVFSFQPGSHSWSSARVSLSHH